MQKPRIQIQPKIDEDDEEEWRALGGMRKINMS
jgi:hypothetical protein